MRKGRLGPETAPGPSECLPGSLGEAAAAGSGVESVKWECEDECDDEPGMPKRERRGPRPVPAHRNRPPPERSGEQEERDKNRNRHNGVTKTMGKQLRKQLRKQSWRITGRINRNRNTNRRTSCIHAS